MQSQRSLTLLSFCLILRTSLSELTHSMLADPTGAFKSTPSSVTHCRHETGGYFAIKIAKKFAISTKDITL